MSNKNKYSHFLNPKVLGIFLFVVACTFYINTIPNGYNMDDVLVTMKHHHTQQGIKSIPEIFKSPYYEDAVGNKFGYRPVTLASFAIEHQFFGEQANVSHTINVLLYGMSVVLIFYLFFLLTQSKNVLLPFLIALLFAIHPIHTEVVNSIKNRDVLLALFFALSACIAFWKAIQEKINIPLLIIGLIAFTLGMLSKISIMPFAYFIPAFLILCRSTSLRVTSFISLFLAGISLYGFSGAIPIGKWNFSQAIILASSIILLPSILHLYIHKNKYPEDYALFLKMIPFLLINLGVLYLTITQSFFGYAYIIWLIGLLFIIPLKNHLIPSLIFIVVGGFLYYQYDPKYHYFISLLPMFVLASEAETIKEKRIAIYILLITSVIYLTTYILQDDFKTAIPLVLFLAIFFFSRLKAKLIPAISIALSLFMIVSSAIIGEISMLLSFILLAILILKKNYRSDFPRRYVIISLFILISCIGAIEVITKWENSISPPNIETIVDNPPTTNSNERTIDFVENPLLYETDNNKKIATSISISGWYLKMLVAPYPLCYYYGYDTMPIINPFHWKVFLAIIMLLILLMAGLVYTSNKPLISLGCILLLIGIAQFSNLLVPVPGIVGERFLYVASLGFSVILAYILHQIYNKIESKQVNRFAFWGFILILSMICLTYTWERNKQWKDEQTLFENDIVHLPKSAKAHQLLGKRYAQIAAETTEDSQKSALLMKAVDNLEKCSSIYSSFPYVNVDLGDAYLQLNEYDKALNAFERGTRIDTLSAEAFFKAGATSELLGEIAKAEKYYLSAIEKGEDEKESYLNLATLYFNQSRFEEGVFISESALMIWQNDIVIMNSLGNGLFNLQRYQDALYIFELMYQQTQDPDTAAKINYLKAQLDLNGQ